MTTISIKHFDVLAYVKKAKSLGTSEELAEYQARQMEILADTIQEQRQELEILKQAEPATKVDIKELEIKLIKWVIGTGAATILALAGLLKYMIHP
jgi:predicted HAD superfamily hydrolase